MDVLRVTILGEPVPAQMGALLWNGQVAKKGTERSRAYKKHVGLLTRLAVNKSGWHATKDDRFAVTARFFVGNERTIDVDNCAKCLLDGLKLAAFPDDRQVVELHLYKSIARGNPRTEVEIVRSVTSNEGSE
jgi:Holliday junction resolvase RusA-like endonuclease